MKRLAHALVVGLSVVSALSSAAAQMPKPSPEMERLIKLLDGRWDMAVTYEPSEAMPQGASATGTETSRPGPGRHSVVFETTSRGPGDTFEAHGVISWSPLEHAYKLHWFTSTETVAAYFTGRWEGQDLVFTGVERMMGKEMASRHRITDIRANSFRYVIDMGPTPPEMKKILTIQYSKARS